MRIDALTVCVDYADLLTRTIGGIMGGVDSLTVVTTAADAATIDLCNRHGASIVTTDAFTRNGAAFNKGLAMAEAWRTVHARDWCLFIDADILPPDGWRGACTGLEPGYLYSAVRVPRLPQDVIGVGYFQLFHASDPRAAAPLTSWHTASCYDNEFKNRWPEVRQLPFELRHLDTGGNWCGRGNAVAMEAMRAERIRLRGWQHERL